MHLFRLMIVAIAAVALLPSVAVHAQEQPKNLLFFGNSFTIGNGGWNVPRIVQDIATAAGHPTPNVHMRADGGLTFANHIANSSTTTAINSLPSGQSWDAFVMQDYSTRATTVTSISGNRTAHRTDAVTLAGLVRNHSPNAHPVLFQTWARSPLHNYYPTYFADPAAMQTEIRTGYELSAGDVAAAYGSATIAPVGDGFEAYGWTGLYGSDEYHANNRGSLLAGMILYSSIYDRPLTDVNLSGVLSNLGLPSTDGAALKAVASTVVPEPAALASIAMAGLLLVRRRRC